MFFPPVWGSRTPTVNIKNEPGDNIQPTDSICNLTCSGKSVFRSGWRNYEHFITEQQHCGPHWFIFHIQREETPLSGETIDSGIILKVMVGFAVGSQTFQGELLEMLTEQISKECLVSQKRRETEDDEFDNCWINKSAAEYVLRRFSYTHRELSSSRIIYCFNGRHCWRFRRNQPGRQVRCLRKDGTTHLFSPVG